MMPIRAQLSIMWMTDRRLTDRRRFYSTCSTERRPRVLADVAGRHLRVVLENDQVLAVDGLADEALLERQRLHREQVVAHHPRVLDVGRRGDEVGHEHHGLPPRLHVDDLVLAGVAAGALDPHARPNLGVAVEPVHDARGVERHEVVLQVAGAVARVRDAWRRAIRPAG